MESKGDFFVAHVKEVTSQNWCAGKTEYSLEVSPKEMKICGSQKERITFQALYIFPGRAVNFHLGDCGDVSSNSDKGEG